MATLRPAPPTPSPLASTGSLRRLSGQHIPPPRGALPPSTTQTLVARGPPATLRTQTSFSPTASSRTAPPPLHENVSLLVRAPSLRAKAADEWQRLDATRGPSITTDAQARTLRDVDSRSDTKGGGLGRTGSLSGMLASSPLAVTMKPLPYAMPPTTITPQPASSPQHLPHRVGRMVIRRLDPNAPLPPRPKGPPPPYAVLRPTMGPRPPFQPPLPGQNNPHYAPAHVRTLVQPRCLPVRCPFHVLTPLPRRVCIGGPGPAATRVLPRPRGAAHHGDADGRVGQGGRDGQWAGGGAGGGGGGG